MLSIDRVMNDLCQFFIAIKDGKAVISSWIRMDYVKKVYFCQIIFES